MSEEYELTPEAAEEAVSSFTHQKGNPFEWDWLSGLWDWLMAIYNRISSIAYEAASAVWGWVGPWFESIWSWLTTLPATIWSMLGPWFEAIWDQVVELPARVWEWLGPWFESILDWLTSLAAQVANLSLELGTIIADYLSSLWENIADSFARIPGVITDTLADPITDWFGELTATISFLFYDIGNILKPFFVDLPMWYTHNFKDHFIIGMSISFEWVGKWFEGLAGDTLRSLLTYVQKVGRVDPTNAPSVAEGLMTLVGTSVAALSTMTLAGELMHPLKEIGMGHISAMIGDVINYRVISGAFMGALVGAVLVTPLRYYFNYTLRPWLPGPGEIAEAMSRDLFIDPDSLNPELAGGIKALVGPDGGVAFEKRLLGYRGFHDEYYPLFKELANTRIGYFALAGIAREGTFDEAMFTSELMRAGYWSKTRPLLLDMYRHQALAATKELYAGVPMTAFKEGWISEVRLAADLTRLGVPEDKLPRYLDAAWLLYEFDLLSDRLAGLKEAYRKGLVTDAAFTGTLTGWGMAAERAAEHLTREQIRRYGKL